MINTRHPQLFPREPLAATDMRGRTCAARCVVASGIGMVRFGLAVLTSDPGGGPGM